VKNWRKKMAYISRRSFLKSSGSMLSLAALGTLRPKLLFAQGQQNGNGRNLVQINFVGGYDSFALFPYYEGPVADYLSSVRPNIFVDPNQVVTVGNQVGVLNKIGLHPAWDTLSTAADGKIKIVQMTGTRNYRGGSHSLLQQIHSRGVDHPGNSEQRGWFGRISETQQFELFQAWGLGGGNKIDFRTNSSAYKPLVVGNNLGNFAYRDRDNSTLSISGYNTTRERNYFREIRDELFDMNLPDSDLVELLNEGMQVTRSAIDTVQLINNNYPEGDYSSTGFGRSCRALSKILKYQADTPDLKQKNVIAYLQRGGFDTHGGQVGSLDNSLPDISENLAVLIDDLKDHGDGSAWQNTTFSMNTDFGRTTKENGGAGTDHAHAYSNMIFGGRVAPGIVGAPPSMQDLQSGNRVAVTTFEYRDGLSEILNDMGIDPYSIFTESAYVRTPMDLFV